MATASIETFAPCVGYRYSLQVDCGSRARVNWIALSWPEGGAAPIFTNPQGRQTEVIFRSQGIHRIYASCQEWRSADGE